MAMLIAFKYMNAYAMNEFMLNNKIELAHHVDLITKPNAHINQLKI